MVFVQALARPNGPAGACLEKARSGQCELLVCDAILAEARAVVSRPKLRRTFIRATDEDVDDFFTRLDAFVTRIDAVLEAFILTRDPRTRCT
jgi:predicted nucleic acid-binding protein